VVFAAAALLGLAGVLVPAAHAAGTAKPLVVSLPEEPSSLDLTTTTNSPSDFPVDENFMESLWGVGPDSKLVPTLATWDTSSDGKVITFHLRHGVKFHSGDPFTAADVVFSYDRSIKGQPVFARRAVNVDHLEVVDPYTVKFIFKKFDAQFMPTRDLYIVSKAYHDRVGEKTFLAHPVGTGPYRFVSYQPGQSITLTRFDGYWGKQPQVKDVKFVFAKEATTRVAALRAGEADIIAGTPYDQVPMLKSEGFKTAGIGVYPTVMLMFAAGNPGMPWDKPKVREAIAHAIDDDALVKNLFKGVPERSAMLAPGEFGYDPTLKPYSYDPALAKKLLAEAGYPHGFKMPLYYYAPVYGTRETAEAVVLYLQAVGIEAKADARDGSQVISMVRKAHSDPRSADFVLLNGAPLANTDTPLTPLTLAFSSRSPFSMYDNPAFDKIVDEAVTETDDRKREDLIKQAYRMLYDDVSVISLWNSVREYAMKSNIDYTPTPRVIAMYIKDITVH